MKPLNLDDGELDEVMRAAAPLARGDRDAFLKAVAAALREQDGPLGPGVVHRVVAQVQRQFFDPPNLSRSAGKYR